MNLPGASEDLYHAVGPMVCIRRLSSSQNMRNGFAQAQNREIDDAQ